MLSNIIFNLKTDKGNIAIPSHTTFDDLNLPRKKNKQKLYKVMPTQVARQVRPEDILEEKTERFAPADRRLQLISEEQNDQNTYGQEDYTERSDRSEANNNSNPTQKKNIFHAESLHNSRYQEINKGPIIRNGKLVRHSIAGSQETFERYQRKKQMNWGARQSQETDTSFSSDTTVTARRGQRLGTTSFATDSLSLVANAVAKKLVEPVRKETRKEPKVSQEQLLDAIDQMKARQNAFYRNVDAMSHSLRTSDMLFFTKEQRCLDNFEKAQHTWDKNFYMTSARLGRSPTESVAVRADEYREKKERATTFDIIKNDEERHGTLYWYMALRKVPGVKEKRGAVVKDDIPAGFHTAVVDRPVSSLEIIRKPKILTQPTSTRESTQNFHSTRSTQNLFSTPKMTERTEKEYYQSRFSMNQNLIKKIKAPAIDIEDFAVITIFFIRASEIVKYFH